MSYVVFKIRGYFFGEHICFVHDCINQTVAVEWATIRIVTVTCPSWGYLRFGVLKYFSVVCFYMRRNVWHTTIADFHGVSIDNFVESMVGWKVFFYKAKECSTDISFDLKVKWWVVPDYVPSPTAVSTRSWGVFEFRIKTRFLQNFLVFVSSFLEFFFVAREV